MWHMERARRATPQRKTRRSLCAAAPTANAVPFSATSRARRQFLQDPEPGPPDQTGGGESESHPLPIHKSQRRGINPTCLRAEDVSGRRVSTPPWCARDGASEWVGRSIEHPPAAHGASPCVNWRPRAETPGKRCHFKAPSSEPHPCRKSITPRGHVLCALRESCAHANKASAEATASASIIMRLRMLKKPNSPPTLTTNKMPPPAKASSKERVTVRHRSACESARFVMCSARPPWREPEGCPSGTKEAAEPEPCPRGAGPKRPVNLNNARDMSAISLER